MSLSNPIAIILPFLFYIWLILQIDRYEKEPSGWIIAVFLWGAIPALMLSMVTEIGLLMVIRPFYDQITLTYINYGLITPIAEETFKGLAILLMYLLVRREFDDWVDGIIYGSMAGFGFAVIEKLLQSVSVIDPEVWKANYLINIIAFGFAHAIYTAFIGIGFGVARLASKQRNKWLAPLCGWLGAVLAHSAYDLGNFYGQTNGNQTLIWNAIAYLIPAGVMIYLIIRAIAYQKSRLRQYLPEEVPQTILESNYFALCGRKNNQQSNFQLKQTQPRKFIQLCGELAQRKEQLAKLGKQARFSHEIEPLRQKIRALQPLKQANRNEY